MSVPPLRASLPPGQSSVPPCRVHHFTVITVFLLCSALCTVASSQPKDLCQQNPVTFADKIHTIGFIDGKLWAITKDDWQVYKLTPCNPANYSLVHCMEVDSPVEVDTKWPKLAEAVKSAAKEKDFSFPVDNSVVMDSSQYEHTVLAMHSDSFNGSKYFGFVFGKNDQVKAEIAGEMSKTPGLWISSDVKNKAYSLFDSGKEVQQIKYSKAGDDDGLMIRPNGTLKNICNGSSKDDHQVQFQEGDCTGLKMVWSVSKGVLYNNQFYLFASDLVYIFSDQAETGLSKMQTVALADFFHCYEPSTMPHPTSPNATNHQFTTNSTHMTTTVKGSHTTLIVIIVLVVVFLLICCCACCCCCVQASKTGKGVGNSKPSSSSMKDSNASVKVRTSQKGPIKKTQQQGITPAQTVSLGNQSQSKVTTPAPKVSTDKVPYYVNPKIIIPKLV